MNLDEDQYVDVDDDSDEEHVPIFTPELAALKEKEMRAAGLNPDG